MKTTRMSVTMPATLHAELLAYQSKQTAKTGRKPSNAEIIASALMAYLKMAPPPTEEVEVEAFKPPVDEIVRNIPQEEPETYAITKVMANIRTQKSPAEIAANLARLRAAAEAGELADDPDEVDD